MLPQKRLNFFILKVGVFSLVTTVFFGHSRTFKRLRSILLQQQLIKSFKERKAITSNLKACKL